MIAKFILGVGLCVLMLVTSIGTYVYLGGRASRVAVQTQKPTSASPRPNAYTLPGTLFLSQNGAIYSLSIGRFHQLTPEEGWTQPYWNPGGANLLAVRRNPFYSDVYILGRFGQVGPQLTHNGPPRGSNDTVLMHWSFYPRLGPDPNVFWMSYDEPKIGYDVPLSIWAVPVGGTMRQGKLWTNAIDYTGGDIQPIPLPNGGLMYTKYSRDGSGNRAGQLWYATKPSRPANGETLTTDAAEGRPLTTTDENCSQPSISPDGTQVAMICSHQKQVSFLAIAAWSGSTMGPRRLIVTDQLVAQPTWAPDGSGIAYLAPGANDSPFQLWFLPKNAYAPPVPTPTPTPSPTPGGPYSGTLASPTPVPPAPAPVIKPIQLTANNGFDATSPIAWAP